jgi:hypothetical protein
LAVAVLPAEAGAASAHDEAAARTVLTAGYVALSEVIRTWPRVTASLNRLRSKFAHECPRVGAGSPQNEPAQQMAYEVAGALWATAYGTDAPIARRFIQRVHGVSSSNAKLNREFHRFVKGLKEMIALKVPPLCADVRAWAATGYRSVPASTLRFDAHVEAIDVEIPSPKLADPYLTPADRSLVPKLERLIYRFDELEFVVGQQDWNNLLETLALNQ